MSQLITLLWLKLTLFRNSLRTSKAVANRIASTLGMLAAVALALIMAASFGIAAYALTAPDFGLQAMRTGRGTRSIPSAEFIFFSIFSMSYLIWATLPLSIGSSRQFDPGHLLLYPISFRKLFAVDFISEIASLQSVFAIPAVLAVGVGVGLARGKLAAAMLVAFLAVAFGVALSKCVSASIGSLIRKRRTRGETLLALIGAVAGLSGVAFAQIAPVVFRQAESIAVLRWTPPGAVAYALTEGLKSGNAFRFTATILILTIYTLLLIGFTYWLSRRAILGGGAKRRKRATVEGVNREVYRGWQLPFVSSSMTALIEKELRYASRNAQLRMMALMPLILIGIRLMNRRGFNEEIASEGGSLVNEFLKYGEGLMATGGILYVFLILTGLSCNLFAFEHAGMRTLVLSPVDRRQILVAKNVAITAVALILSIALMLISQVVFRDVTPGVLLFGGLSFLIYAALISVIGNSLSMRFPKRMKMGSRMNVSGVVGLMLIPMIMLLCVPPLAAVAAGFIAQSLMVEYATLAVLAVLSIGLYAIVINSQGETLEQRQLEILEAVTDPGND